MKQQINVKVVRDKLILDPEVVYCQPDGWFGMVTRPLVMGIMYHENDGVNEKLPCVMYVGGGGWFSTSPLAFTPDFVELAHAGYVVAFPDYQLSSEAKFPSQLKQIRQAVRFLRANANRWHIDPDRIGVIGESAGAHISNLMGSTNHHQEFESGEYLDYPSTVSAVCSWYGPVTGQGLAWQLYAGTEPGHKGPTPDESLMNPLIYLDKDTVPYLLLHGTADTQVDISTSSDVMYDALLKNGTPVEYYQLVDAEHTGVHFFQPEIMQIMIRFFNTYLK